MSETNGTVETAEPNQKEDKLTNSFGSFGRWQIFLFVILVVPVKFSGYTMLLSIIFLAPKTTFRCVETISNTETEFIKNSSCYTDCVKYEYYSQFENTIISEWDLICKRAWLADLTQTVNMCGILVGSMLFGYISDRHGRRPGIIISCLIQLCSSFATAFCKDYWTFTIVRFFLGSATGGNIIGAFVLMSEITGPAHRDFMTSFFHVPLAVAEIMMPVFGYYLRSWDKFSIGLAIPTLIYLAYFFVLPESPKWLISVGRLEEASVAMTKAANMNKMPSGDMLETVTKIAKEIKINKESKRAKATYIDLFRNPTLRSRNLISCTCWFILGICFYGTSQYMGQTSSNVFITMCLAGVLKIPSMLVSGYLYNRFGRRATLIGLLVASGLSSGLLAEPDSCFYLKLIAGAVGVGCSAGAFTTMYTYTSELFPTVARNMAMGASSTVSRVGSALAPFVAGLKTESIWLPPLIFGVAPLVAVAACWPLPETKGKKLTDTIDEN